MVASYNENPLELDLVLDVPVVALVPVWDAVLV
jgi:hypothetical protein